MLQKPLTFLYLLLNRTVRKRIQHIVAIIFLGSSLLFNQVALNFFHDKHDAHEAYNAPTNKAQLVKHGEHCKICGIDTLFNLFSESPTVLTSHRVNVDLVVFFTEPVKFISVSLYQNRAPPSTIS